MNSSVSSSLTFGILNQLSQLGIDNDVIIEKCDINRYELNKKHGRISSQAHYALLDECRPYQKTFFAQSGLENAYSLFPELFSLCCNEASLADAIRSYVRYRALIGNCDLCEVEVTPNGLKVDYTDQGPNQMVSSAVANFAFLHDISSQYLVDFQAEIGFIHNNNIPEKMINRRFATKCLFGTSHNYFIIRSPLVNQANALFNQRLYQLQRRTLDNIHQTIQSSSFSASIENIIATLMTQHNLTCGHSTLNKVCEYLRISRWTLNNKLSNENQCFTDLYNKVRLNKAVVLLTETNKSMSEISELTRFSSQSVFSRFFRTQTNMSPIQFRKHTQLP
ncbi:helix-turn-helix transcriptional regulator [Vibrio ostreae]|uniref:Helix-turn-helix transcriptional regulator n=2 Tax=Vibrio ostreae TaxID=2841925 RepID=A0A975YMB0_9VIBR|nr:helix-turn-helix transcriptional regulator [Vibrio ostreae]